MDDLVKSMVRNLTIDDISDVVCNFLLCCASFTIILWSQNGEQWRGIDLKSQQPP